MVIEVMYRVPFISYLSTQKYFTKKSIKLVKYWTEKLSLYRENNLVLLSISLRVLRELVPRHFY